MSRNSALFSDPFIARIPFIDLDATGVAAAIIRRVRLAVRRWQKRRTIRALERLDDWILEDIGISRAELPRVVDDLVGDDPRPASLARTAEMARQKGTPAELIRPLGRKRFRTSAIDRKKQDGWDVTWSWKDFV